MSDSLQNIYNQKYNVDNLFDQLLDNISPPIDQILSLNRYAIIKKFTELSSVATNIDSSFNALNSFVNSIFRLSGDNDILELNKSLDISGVNRINNDLSYEAITFLDNSENIVLNLRQLNEFLDSKNFSNGGEIINTGSEYVNGISQTFFEVMTQQPHAFDSSGVPGVTSGSILLQWSFDSILAKHDNNDVLLAKLSYLNGKTKQLPFIDSIVIEISGNVDGSSTGWISYDTITVETNDDYNDGISFKQVLIGKYTGSNSPLNNKETILSSTDPFDVRIYGINNSQDYPLVNNRDLVFSGVSFLAAGAPSHPNFVSESIGTNTINIVYDVSFTENGVPDSLAQVTEYIIDYSQNETLASSIYSLVTTDLSNNATLPSNIDNLDDFNIALTGLRYGTKYNYDVRVRNDLVNSFSVDSDARVSNYTDIPSSNGINTTVAFNLTSNSYTNVSTTNFNNNSIIYINLSSGKNITFANNAIQTIEITNPNASTVGVNMKGYGKFVDNSLNIVSIKVTVNTTFQQFIWFDAVFNSFNVNNYGLGFLDYYSMEDIYTNNISSRGYRLKGQFQLLNIANGHVNTLIGNASVNAYTLSYEYIRHADIGGANQTTAHEIFVDNLSLDPEISMNYINVGVNSVLYNMGIPSVKNFDISLSRTYKNINSVYGYINANNNNRIAEANIAGLSTSASSQNITILNSSINSNGEYTRNDLVFNNIHYTDNILLSGYSLTTDEKAYSLKNVAGVSSSQDFSTNHYCDRTSFNLVGGAISSCKLDLLIPRIYEISNISLLGTDLTGFYSDAIQYTDHQKVIKDNTLLYVDGLFKSNASQTYPIISDFSYGGDGVNITNAFSAGQNSYDLSGNLSGNNSGYKWIGFNSADISLVSPSTGPAYYALGKMLNDKGLFSMSDIINIFDINSTDAIGFCTNGSNIGNLKKAFNAIGGIWYENGGATYYANTLEKEFGATVIDDDGDFGIVSNSGFYVFIGLKN